MVENEYVARGSLGLIFWENFLWREQVADEIKTLPRDMVASARGG